MSYTPTYAQIGAGYSLAYSTTTGGTYTVVAEILDLKLPGFTQETAEIYRNDNVTLFGEKIPGWKKCSDCEVKLVYNKTQKAAIMALVGPSYYWKFTRPDTTSTDSWYGFIADCGDEVPLKTEMVQTFKIAVSGAITFVAA